MNDERTPRWRVVWILPPVLVGIAFVVFMAGDRQAPSTHDLAEEARPVRVIEAVRIALTPWASGYGTVRPAKVWAAVAQVPGRVVETYDRLRDGEIVTAGTLLFRIDPVDTELRVAQVMAELAELEVRRVNAESSLALDQRSLELAEREQRRIARLAANGTASQSDVDDAERAVLNARTVVQNTRNTIALFPAQRRLLEARLAQAERDLANTEVRAPFDLRVTDLAVERDQYVGVGQTLFRGDAVEGVEITAQVEISALRHLFYNRDEPIPSIAAMPGAMAAFTGFRPLVRMDLGDGIAEWEADFVRFSDEVDPQTRTIGVVVAVDDPLGKAVPGRRPPLSKGMFVQVIIRGRTQPDRLVVPRTAVRNGIVYRLDDTNRLQVAPVSVQFSLGAVSVIEQGVTAGDTIVVSDLVPAVTGMLLAPVPDADAQAVLGRAVDGPA
jgi:RND family efflux transporter MFP subunit